MDWISLKEAARKRAEIHRGGTSSSSQTERRSTEEEPRPPPRQRGDPRGGTSSSSQTERRSTEEEPRPPPRQRGDPRGGTSSSSQTERRSTRRNLVLLSDTQVKAVPEELFPGPKVPSCTPVLDFSLVPNPGYVWGAVGPEGDSFGVFEHC
ncbi:hypothetical protein NHX12_020439 [Muraenolepis orangiensis]|uniref:Uncharacterized protein n=1 Tax=Muraenolepis orangiensis TaxID=630683 RepID=A0A9Q0IT04_9TELE|nr:hypothetical protein NHX12_020439 [Muraenolepis orangiensis]